MLMDFALADSIDEEYQTFCREEGTSREMGALESDQGSIANPLLASSSSSSSSGAPAIRSKVQQLTVGFWPTGAAIEGLILPGPFKRITTSFERYFHNKHNDKKGLHWKHALGDAEVSGYFPKIRKSYTMVVTTLQAMALIYMSERHSMSASSSDSSENVEKLTVAELQTGLSLDVEIVKRVVHSLACGKFKVLLKTGPGGSKKVDSTDEFWPNRGFTSPKIRFSIPMASLDFANSIKSKAVEDRSFAIDACIVRTMKARKRMGHSALIAEVMQQLTTFKPDSTTVKKRVEALIDREFLARHEDSGGSWTREYDYLA
jgi:cullin 1